jgi:hypothetical protein
MATIAERSRQLRETEGFLVKSPGGAIGRVEEIWVDQANEPRALAVRTNDGRHGLLLGEDVVAVQHEQRWVVAPSRPTLLELEPPRLSMIADRGGSERRIAASWQTTGAILPAAPRPTRRWRLSFPDHRRAAVRPDSVERPLWGTVATLYAALVFVVAFVITLAFVIARLVSGAAY